MEVSPDLHAAIGVGSIFESTDLIKGHEMLRCAEWIVILNEVKDLK